MSSFSLTLSEIIKVNQLVRLSIDLVGFTKWYDQLSSRQQHVLISTLFEFAHQAGVDEKTWEEALSVGKVTSYSDQVLVIKSFHNYELRFHDHSGFITWLQNLSESERRNVFTIGVYLFGTTEGKVFREESKEWCNHWWHRDLLDRRVVEDILANSKFYMTSMEDDDRFKSAE